MRYVLAFFLLHTISCGSSQNTTRYNSRAPQSDSFPKATGIINDFEGILSQLEEEELTALIAEHGYKTGNQIAIVTLDSIDPYKSLDDYSLDLANYWGVGQAEKNNGILIALSSRLRQISIHNGYEIEAQLSDVETKRIIDDLILPHFRNAEYYIGLRKGLIAIIEKLEDEDE